MFDACGGLDNFIAVREAMDTMQDVYFLRKDGVVTDQYWHVWTNTFFRFYAKMPTFLRVFDFAAEEGLLHPEFVGFYRGTLDGGTPRGSPQRVETFGTARGRARVARLSPRRGAREALPGPSHSFQEPARHCLLTA